VVASVAERWNRASPLSVFVEDYAYGLAGLGGMRIAELGGAVKAQLFAQHAAVVQPVNAMTARKIFLGKLPKGKGAAQKAVQDACIALGLVPKDSGSDEADAFVIANAGRALLGLPFATIG